MNKAPRRYSVTPEDRAQALVQPGYMASGHSYISVIMRDAPVKTGKVPFYSDPEKCDHGFSMCPTWDCIESWSLDWKVLLHRTVAGRNLAGTLGIDPYKFAAIERGGIERLDIEDFRPESSEGGE